MESVNGLATKSLVSVIISISLTGLLCFHSRAAVESETLLERTIDQRTVDLTRAHSEIELDDSDSIRNQLLEATQTETYGNWSLVCRKLKSGTDCFVSQSSSDARLPNGKLLMQIDGIEENGVDGHLMLPPGFMLHEGVAVKIGESSSVAQFAFTTCVPEGCVADIAFTHEQLALLQTSTQVDLAIRIRPGETMHFFFSLQGFTSAFHRMSSITSP